MATWSNTERDYDGDALNITVLLDNMMSDEAENFAPYYSTMDVNKLYSVSKFVSLLGPGNNIMTNYFDPDYMHETGKDTIVGKMNFIDVK